MIDLVVAPPDPTLWWRIIPLTASVLILTVTAWRARR